MPGRALESAIRSDNPIRIPEDIDAIRDPWLAKSALQKSIRWGLEEDALRAAFTLLQTYPDSLYRRLAIIALEDVGLGDLPLVHQAVWVAGKKVWRQANGGDWHIAANLVQRMAVALKSRDACDLIVAAHLHPQIEAQRAELPNLREEELLDIVRDLGKALPIRVLAACRLAETKRFPGETGNCREERFKRLMTVYTRLGVCPSILQIAVAGRSRTPEAISLPLAWIEYKKSSWSRTVKEPLPRLVRIGGWPAATWDKHTRPGKLALVHFAQQCAPLKRFLEANIPPADHHKLVGLLVFRAEGSKLGYSLRFDGADDMLREGIEADLCSASLPMEAIPEALGIVEAHLDQLNDIRRDIAS